jgi:hypothetical protein
MASSLLRWSCTALIAAASLGGCAAEERDPATPGASDPPFEPDVVTEPRPIPPPAAPRAVTHLLRPILTYLVAAPSSGPTDPDPVPEGCPDPPLPQSSDPWLTDWACGEEACHGAEVKMSSVVPSAACDAGYFVQEWTDTRGAEIDLQASPVAGVDGVKRRITLRVWGAREEMCPTLQGAQRCTTWQLVGAQVALQDRVYLYRLPVGSFDRVRVAAKVEELDDDGPRLVPPAIVGWNGRWWAYRCEATATPDGPTLECVEPSTCCSHQIQKP